MFFIFQVNCVDDKYYNILSIDGGGIRGLIPATILEKIEEAAYDYAISKSYDITSMSYPAVHQSYNKIAMKDLFDMSAGTSTGSIIAASLSMPANETDGSLSKTTPKFWAKDIIDIYGFTEQAGIIFPTCEYGKRHVPAWSDVVSKNKNNLKDNKDGEIGLMAFYSPIQMSYPGHAVLTEDLGYTEKNNCRCNRKGKIFKIVGRAPNSEIRGCSDILAEQL